MDRYEYKVKLDEMKEKLSQDKVEEAAAIADTVNWRKVKTVSALCLAGEVYERAERYEDSKDVLQQAYEYSPIGRSIIFRLAQVCMKAGEYEMAMDYYQEFVEIAPNDNMRYILKYKIFRAKGASVAELISILEEYKERESSERWFFELAVLYHKGGMVSKCIEACDELILWFGEGKYVEKALELKMIYQPLTPAQEKVYRRVKQQRTGLVEVSPTDELRSGEILTETKFIPEVQIPAPAFNTINLQRELAENMKQIMEAKEKEEVNDGMENIKKLVNNIPYLQMNQEEVPQEKYGHIETDEEIDGSLNIDFQELLAEESSGQMSLNVPDQPTFEQQITGQMSIEEVLKEWEKTKNAAQAVLEAAEQRKFEAAKARALQEAENIMDRLSDIMPQLEAGVTSKELMEQKYLSDMEKDMANGLDIDLEIPKMEEEIGESQEALEALATSLQETMEQQLDEPFDIATQEVNIEIPDWEEEGFIPTAGEETIEEDLSHEATEAEILPEENIPQQEEMLQEEAVSQEEILVEEPALNEEPALEQEPELYQESTEEIFAADEMQEDAVQREIEAAVTKRMPTEEEIKQALAEVTQSVAEETIVEEKEEPPVKPIERKMERMTFLSEEEKELFSYFMTVAGMEKQICEAMDGIINREVPTGSKSGNLLIEGGNGSGKSALAMNLIKAVQNKQNTNKNQVGKISAAALNKKDMIPLINKVAGGYLLIEKAGDLTKETAEKLALALEGNTRGLVVIMEDTAAQLKKAVRLSPKLAEKFTEKISIPVFTSDELVAFAKSYAREHGYIIEEMAVLALYNRISGIQKIDRATYIVEVKEIMDGAIEKANRMGLKKLFLKNQTEDGMRIIRENDFE